MRIDRRHAICKLVKIVLPEHDRPGFPDLLNDESLSARVRRQAPRALKLIRTQRSVDVLVQAIGHGNISIRESVSQVFVVEESPKIMPRPVLRRISAAPA